AGRRAAAVRRRTVMFDGIFRPEHLIIILAICILIFGPKKLPQLGRGIGESIREFKKSMAQAKGEEELEEKK
ncbi:MAG: twin-arginine translocase TatA/TatE family subunit, partial [Streptosporangiaceae bacterium]